MQAAVNLARDRLGELGVDLLYDLTGKPTPARWSPRLPQSLAKPARPGESHPGDADRARSALGQSPCEAKRALLPGSARRRPRAPDSSCRPGPTDGCSLFSLGDCWSCLRKDSALSDALKSPRSAGQSAPPSGH